MLIFAVEKRGLPSPLFISHKAVPVLYERQQIAVDRFRRVDVTVVVNVPRPPRPARLRVWKRIKPARVHVPDAEAVPEIKEVPVEPLPAVREARRRRQPRARADHDGVRGFDLVLQPQEVLFAAARVVGQSAAQSAHEQDPLLQRLRVIRFLLI